MRLIDAEQFVTEMENNIGNVYNPDIIKGMRFAIELINSRPTAFDKEKVIEELRGEIHLTVHDPMIAGRYIKKKRAIEIVEKGGIENEEI